MPTESKSTTLPTNELSRVTTRLRRAHGQLQGVIFMLESSRSCEDVLTQLAAVDKAINTAAFTLISTRLVECLDDPALTPDQRSDTAARLQKLFLALA